MAGKFINSSKSYLVESFVLNSINRVITKKGKGLRPDPSFSSSKKADQETLKLIPRNSGKKASEVDLQTLGLLFEKYVQVVNLFLSRMYNDNDRVQSLGQQLSEYKGRAYTLLREEKDLNYQHNEDIRALCFERLYRNALEHAGRTLLADWTRKQLFNAAIKVLSHSSDDCLRLLRRKRIPSDLIRKVRDVCESTKNNGAGFHYSLGVLRQLRLALDNFILEEQGVKITWRGRQRKYVASLLRDSVAEKERILILTANRIKTWMSKGYPFSVPCLRSHSLDFSASTENSPGQGYWFSVDEKRENEILFHIKLPPGIDGTHHERSPYKGKTLTFRFLDWMPRAAIKDKVKGLRAKDNGDSHRYLRLKFRAAMFEDMHRQLMNTIEIQQLNYKLSKLKLKRSRDTEEIVNLQSKISELKNSRRSAPPRLLLRGNRITLQIPFLAPDGSLIQNVLGEREYEAKAGVDRGIRVPVVISVMKGKEYRELLLRVEQLVKKREFLRKQAYILQSVADRQKNNWERKRSGLSYPGYILKKDRHIAALWRKVRRLDREIARIVASRTVWFCEEHGVKTLFFEDLRSYQAHAGSKDLSYNLSSNLWGKVIDTVRYMRESLGHSRYSIWTVNPHYTSQICHACGERGRRVEDETSTIERKGGEYFYCEKCDDHFHADVNAARNIIHVHPGPSTVAGRSA
jgi:transposase